MNATVKRIKSEAEAALEHAFVSTRDQLPGQPAVQVLRKQSAELFAESGLPSRRTESWHYTDLRAALRTMPPLATAPDAIRIAKAAALLEPVKDGHMRAVIVDGFYIAELSSPVTAPGFMLRPLDEVLMHGDAAAFATLAASGLGGSDAALALNTAFMRGGVVINVAAEHQATDIVELVNITIADTPAAIFSRSVIIAGAGSTITLVERHITLGEAAVQKNDTLVLLANEGSQVEHIFIRERSAVSEVHVHSLLLTVGEDVKLNSYALVEGGGLLRRQIFARFEAQNSELSISGSTLLRGKDHADTTLVVEHTHPHNTSREYFKHIVDGAATGVFQGKIIVAPHAQKTDGVMKSQTILIGDDAAMYNKPELEIFADDVTCGHGATVGALDPAQLFYAMSRGIPREAAETLLLVAFAGDAIDRVADETLRELLRNRVRIWLEGRVA